MEKEISSKSYNAVKNITTTYFTDRTFNTEAGDTTTKEEVVIAEEEGTGTNGLRLLGAQGTGKAVTRGESCFANSVRNEVSC